MGSEFSPEKIQQVKDEAHESMKETLDELRRDEPKVVDTAAAAVGSTLGGAASFTALYFGGSVPGRSAAEITAGLAAGAIVGGMMAGVGVLAAPVAVLGVVGYAIAKKRRNAKQEAARNAKQEAALRRAIEKLYAIQERLMTNAEYIREVLAENEAYITELEKYITELKNKDQNRVRS